VNVTNNPGSGDYFPDWGPAPAVPDDSDGSDDSNYDANDDNGTPRVIDSGASGSGDATALAISGVLAFLTLVGAAARRRYLDRLFTMLLPLH